MVTGRKALQTSARKDLVRRHGAGGGRGRRRVAGAAREEKAIETRTRQAGKKAIRAALDG